MPPLKIQITTSLPGSNPMIPGGGGGGGPETLTLTDTTNLTLTDGTDLTVTG